ncbi:unnamed protein product [Clonostachys rosea]|uniref:Uncharacterized protein n=1 Tax=Bionectria ochroleuca TaxID=29856 RepID=A0ABY6TYX4_BIOOC|nr:unnamed protein product [Clonostachys rosea]
MAPAVSCQDVRTVGVESEGSKARSKTGFRRLQPHNSETAPPPLSDTSSKRDKRKRGSPDSWFEGSDEERDSKRRQQQDDDDRMTAMQKEFDHLKEELAKRVLAEDFDEFKQSETTRLNTAIVKINMHSRALEWIFDRINYLMRKTDSIGEAVKCLWKDARGNANKPEPNRLRNACVTTFRRMESVEREKNDDRCASGNRTEDCGMKTRSVMEN